MKLTNTHAARCRLPDPPAVRSPRPVPAADAGAAGAHGRPLQARHGLPRAARHGRGDATVSFSFRADQMKDLLTSFYAVDLGGGTDHLGALRHRRAARPAAPGDPDHRPGVGGAQPVPAPAQGGADLGQGLRRGVRRARPRASSRSPSRPTAAVVRQGHRLVILTDGGAMRSADLAGIAELTILDEGLRADVVRLLDLALEGRRADAKRLAVTAVGQGRARAARRLPRRDAGLEVLLPPDPRPRGGGAGAAAGLGPGREHHRRGLGERRRLLRRREPALVLDGPLHAAIRAAAAGAGARPAEPRRELGRGGPARAAGSRVVSAAAPRPAPPGGRCGRRRRVAPAMAMASPPPRMMASRWPGPPPRARLAAAARQRRRPRWARRSASSSATTCATRSASRAVRRRWSPSSPRGSTAGA